MPMATMGFSDSWDFVFSTCVDSTGFPVVFEGVTTSMLINREEPTQSSIAKKHEMWALMK